MAAVTLDDFVKKKAENVIRAEVYDVMPVKAEPEHIKAERVVALTEKGMRLLKRLFVEGKISFCRKPWWWDKV